MDEYHISHRMSKASYSYLVLLVHNVAAGARSPAAALRRHSMLRAPSRSPILLARRSPHNAHAR
eukprot:4128567-Pleurochrysis_carterae.AAC.1